MKRSRPLASALYYTYTLGSSPKSLYVPLTSQCNSLSLPETRGPEFTLPPQAVAALLRVRDFECSTSKWTHWCNWLDTQEFPQKLPPLERNVDTRDNDASKVSLLESFQSEIDGWIARDEANNNDKKQQTLVIAGEGEPTLKWNALLQLSSKYSSFLNIRVNTNGLVPSPRGAVDELKQYGVDTVSVALMTADASQYQTLMQPTIDSTPTPHSLVSDFIQQAVACQLDVQVTGVDRPDVDKDAMEQLAQDLGVKDAVRWRPYFP